MAKDPLSRIEAHLVRMDDKVDDLTTNMATVLERIADYTDVKKDVQGLKRFRAWYLGTIGVGATSALGWASGLGKTAMAAVGIGGSISGLH